MWHYGNEKQEIIINPFHKKIKFNPKPKKAAIEIYVSHLEKEVFSLFDSDKERWECPILSSITIEKAEKGSVIVIWGREDYFASFSR